MLDTAVKCLMCPHCGGPLQKSERQLKCPVGHSFDIARQGYVTLLKEPLHGIAGDTSEMLAARHEFLSGGYYQPIQDHVAHVVTARHCQGSSSPLTGSPTVVDVGAGAGDYLSAVLAACPGAQGIGLDVSKFAARRLARHHVRSCGIVADTWRQIPLRDGTASVVLSIFAPRNVSEIARVLQESGTWIVVTPTPQHLRELTAVPGVVSVHEDKAGKLVSVVAPRFALEVRRRIEFQCPLTTAAAELLLAMGPTAHHLNVDERHRVIMAAAETANGDQDADAVFSVTVSVDVSVFTQT
ncbi:putative RNA methyltransferase [Hoyosella subflava]|uniref:rRNA (Guanine-N(1)-)-methyltransferase n=1 Tax=Hoyosella subflava (strain DSM 45089 / JCM 17490 / NBRC 109087 / DQS3-9A1) TaxID=443218 RepID=F6EPW7_HOYSD|nr:methyltransferase domain-containing protein [Hoyosella subflava]AEF41788.1 rRNA (Guanine-N(1)-)-methyltransferase [Hoyosella subflava DQS3-9A1]